MRAALQSIAAPLACCLFAASAHASGFHIDEQDARANGRAGAVTASPGNASTIYYNPGGLGQLRGWHVDAGILVVGPSTTFVDASTGVAIDAKVDVFVLPQGYLSYRLSELVSVGIGFNSPFGLALRWPEASPGRSIVREVSLRTFYFMPAVAVNLSEWADGLSLGAGLDLVASGVHLERDILFGTDLGTVTFGGTAFGVGGRAGLVYRPPALPAWSFGLTYRSPVKLDFSGNVDFDAPTTYRPSLPPDGVAKTSITLPQSLGVGVAFRPIPEWEIEIDGNWRGWSSYDALELSLPGGQTNVSERDWHDSFTVRLGTEYTLEQRWSFRLGAIWDQTPVPTTTLDFQLPDANRIDLSLGLGAAITEAVHVDVGGLYVLPQTRSTSDEDPLRPPVKGSYDIQAWVLGVSLGVTFDPLASTEDGSLDAESLGSGDPSASTRCRQLLRTRAQRDLRPCP